MGLRYEYHPLFTDPNGLLAIFDPAKGDIVVTDKGMSRVSSLVPGGYAKIVSASSVGLPAQTLLHNNTKDFAPRIGLAYRPWGANTVFRAGYGIYFNNSPAQPDAAGSPFAITAPAYANTTPTPTVVLPQVFPSTGTGGPSTINLPTAWNPNARMPYTQQFSATVEHQMRDTALRLSYVNTTTKQELYMRDMNAPLPSAQPYSTQPRAFPNYPSIYYVDNGAYHSYNAGTLEVTHRMASGLYFRSSITLARDIGDDSGDGATSPSPIEDPFNLVREKGPAQSTPTWRWVTSAIYELPFGHGRKFLNSASRAKDLLIGGWQISLVGYEATGQFLTPLWCGNDPTGTGYSGDTSPGFVCIRPDIIGNPHLSNPSVNAWYNVNAYASPAPGHFGNAGVGTIIGPGTNVWHVGVQKYFHFSENPRVPRLRLELTATNIFNHQNLTNPDTIVSDGPGAAATIGDVGSNIWGDRAGPRSMRAGLRLEW